MFWMLRLGKGKRGDGGGSWGGGGGMKEGCERG